MMSTDLSPRRRRPSKARSAIATLLTLTMGCTTLETYLPDIIAIGGTIAQVAAISYAGGKYGNQVNLLMQTLTPAGISIATAYAAKRREKRELDQLLALEAEIEAEYAALEEKTMQPSEIAGDASVAGDWQNVADQQGEGSWGNVADTPGFGTAATEAVEEASSAEIMIAAADKIATVSSGSPWDSLNEGSYTLPKGVLPKGLSGPLEIDVAILKRVVENGKERGVAIDDLDVLTGNGAEGDQVRVYFSPAQDSYVYIVAVDARARVQPLFPPSLPPAAPVRRDAKIVLPAPDDWYGLDQYKGMQHVYVYVSATRNEKLEALMYRFATEPAPVVAAGETIYTVSEPTVVEAAQIKSRGLSNVRPQTRVEIPSVDGKTEQFDATQITGAVAGEDLVVTRVFENR